MTCQKCKTKCSGHRFHEAEKICMKCQDKFTCQVCNKCQHASAFSWQRLVNAEKPSRKTILRCLACEKCKECKRRYSGFHFDAKKQVCKKCSYKKKKCDVCKVNYRDNLFSERSLQNHINHNTKLLCKQCLDKGCTTRETTIYRCVHGCRYGKERFSHRQLQNYHQRGGSLTCIDCQIREGHIRDNLNKSEAWKCTCKKHFAHDATCQLYPSTPNEKRWPGKNVRVSEEEWLFFTESAKYQASKRQRTS